MLIKNMPPYRKMFLLTPTYRAVSKQAIWRFMAQMHWFYFKKFWLHLLYTKIGQIEDFSGLETALGDGDIKVVFEFEKWKIFNFIPFPPAFVAIANALFKTTGKRYYNQPFSTEVQKSQGW